MRIPQFIYLFLVDHLPMPTKWTTANFIGISIQQCSSDGMYFATVFANPITVLGCQFLASEAL